MGEYRLLLFWRCQKLKFYGTLKFLTQDHMGLGNAAGVFIRCQSNFMRGLATMVEHRLLLFLAMGQVLNILWYFEILTWESMAKN